MPAVLLIQQGSLVTSDIRTCAQAMICVEWWCFEAIILLAGRLPHPEVAIDTVGICVNIATTTFMFPFGLAGQTQYGCTELLLAVQSLASRISCTRALCMSTATAYKGATDVTMR